MIKVGMMYLFSLFLLIFGALFIMSIYLGIDLGFDDLFEPAPSGTVDCNYNSRDIHAALCVLTRKTLQYDQTENYIESLNMKLCSNDVDNYIEIGEFYKTKWTADGYTLLTESHDSFGTYSTYSGSFYKGADIKAVVSGSGAGITSYYGHNAMFITGNGPFTTFQQFVMFINSV